MEKYKCYIYLDVIKTNDGKYGFLYVGTTGYNKDDATLNPNAILNRLDPIKKRWCELNQSITLQNNLSAFFYVFSGDNADVYINFMKS